MINKEYLLDKIKELEDNNFTLSFNYTKYDKNGNFKFDCYRFNSRGGFVDINISAKACLINFRFFSKDDIWITTPHYLGIMINNENDVLLYIKKLLEWYYANKEKFNLK